MTRESIGGFTLKAFGLWFEVVTVHHIPVTLAIWEKHGRQLVRRWEV